MHITLVARCSTRSTGVAVFVGMIGVTFLALLLTPVFFTPPKAGAARVGSSDHHQFEDAGSAGSAHFCERNP